MSLGQRYCYQQILPPAPEDIHVEIQRVDNNADMFHRIEVQNRDRSAEDRPTGQEEIIGCMLQEDFMRK